MGQLVRRYLNKSACIYFLRTLGLSAGAPHQVLQCVTLTSLSRLKKGPRPCDSARSHTEKRTVRRATASRSEQIQRDSETLPLHVSQLATSPRTRDKAMSNATCCTPPAQRQKGSRARERQKGWNGAPCQLSLSPSKQKCKVRPGVAPLAGRAPPQTRAPHVFGVGPVSAPAESRSSPELSISPPNLMAILGP